MDRIMNDPLHTVVVSKSNLCCYFVPRSSLRPLVCLSLNSVYLVDLLLSTLDAHVLLHSTADPPKKPVKPYRSLSPAPDWSTRHLRSTGFFFPGSITFLFLPPLENSFSSSSTPTSSLLGRLIGCVCSVFVCSC